MHPHGPRKWRRTLRLLLSGTLLALASRCFISVLLPEPDFEGIKEAALEPSYDESRRVPLSLSPPLQHVFSDIWGAKAPDGPSVAERALNGSWKDGLSHDQFNELGAKRIEMCRTPGGECPGNQGKLVGFLQMALTQAQRSVGSDSLRLGSL